MSLAAIAVDKRAVTYFFAIILLVGGTASFFALGQLEDPAFSIKTAVITTTYPGASPEEVEREVTDRIELALQEMHELDYVESFSRAGFSLVKAEIRPEFWSDRLPQVWDILRRKIREVETQLPPGADRPVIADDFGDVYGFQLALTGDGFTYGELEEYAKELKKQLSLVPGVARIDLWGVQPRAVYIDVSQAQLSALGLTDADVGGTLRKQNMVVDAGSVDVQDQRLRIAPTGQFESPEDIAGLQIRSSIADEFGNLTTTTGGQDSAELIRIGDIGTVKSGYLTPPPTLMRYNGEPAVGISITNIAGINLVDLGRAIDKRLEELVRRLPVGVDVHRVHWQSDIVAEAINGFLISFLEAVGIVLVVLALAMGWRMGIIIGCALVLTILGSFMLMAIFGIDLQRMSLGALIIALGMMVDNAIVVADGVAVRLKQGMDRTQAAVEAASKPAWPLLGATVVAVMAFYPIFASVEGAGEYCRTLFTVVGMSLLLSWLVSVTITPLQCIDMLPAPKSSDVDPYGGKLYRGFRSILGGAIRVRWLTLGTMTALLVVSVIGFGSVKQLFFPDASMRKLMIDYWAPEGTRIQQVASDLKQAEERLLEDKRVESVSTFVGQGPPRFYLPVDPESPYPSYGQLVVNVHDFKDVPALVEELDPWFRQNMPQALSPIRLFGVGPGNTWKFELRISGPAEADPVVLRRLGDQVLAILEKDRLAAYPRMDWRQRVRRIEPEYNQERGRWAAIKREDVANATKRAFDGRTIGLYRERDDLIPIILRHVEEERADVGGLGALQVRGMLSVDSVPLSQVLDGFAAEWEDPLIWRRDRRRTLTVQANPIPGATLPELRASVLGDIDAIKLPPGYSMEWGGEYEDTVSAQASLIPGLIPAGIIMLFILVALFNAFRPPLIILLTIPFALIGMTAGLLATGAPFGFVALLGGMSLSGMMIKNAIVLLDEVNENLAAGKTRYVSVVEAAVGRLRPVVLAAATTVLGVIPLLQDVFWLGLAVTIMVGLTFGTILTMVLLPVLYSILYRIPSPGP